MKEAIVNPGLTVTVKKSPIPQPAPDQIVIKVVAVGANPADWKYVGQTGPKNTGKDISGTVHSVGSDVYEFKPGDRVAALNHEGGFAEYAVASSFAAFHLSPKTSFEEAATTPLPYITAAPGLYYHLQLPAPYNPTLKPTPIVIYGASSAVGAFAVKLARMSNLHPIIAIAGRGTKYVSSIIDPSKGDIVLDYRDGNEAVKAAVRNAVPNLKYAFDAISTEETLSLLGSMLNPHGGKLCGVRGEGYHPDVPVGVEVSDVFAPTMWQPIKPDSEEGKMGLKIGRKEFGYTFFKFLGYALANGLIEGHPSEVVPGGLYGVEKMLNDVKNGVNSGVKYLVKIDGTEGL